MEYLCFLCIGVFAKALELNAMHLPIWVLASDYKYVFWFWGWLLSIFLMDTDKVVYLILILLSGCVSRPRQGLVGGKTNLFKMPLQKGLNRVPNCYCLCILLFKYLCIIYYYIIVVHNIADICNNIILCPCKIQWPQRPAGI